MVLVEVFYLALEVVSQLLYQHLKIDILYRYDKIGAYVAVDKILDALLGILLLTGLPHLFDMVQVLTQSVAAGGQALDPGVDGGDPAGYPPSRHCHRGEVADQERGQDANEDACGSRQCIVECQRSHSFRRLRLPEYEGFDLSTETDPLRRIFEKFYELRA